MIPAEKWWGVLEDHSIAIFPMQLILLVVGALVAIVFFAKPGRQTNIALKTYLVLCFAWIGIVFFLIFGKDLAARNIQGPLFVVLAILFALAMFTTTIYNLKIEGLHLLPRIIQSQEA